MGLAAVGCIGAEPETGQRVWLGAFPVLFLGVAVFLLFIGLQAFVSSRRRSRRLAKVLLALVAGSACGALWMLLVDTVVNAAIRDAVNETAVRVVGVATALLVAAVLLTPNRLRTVVGRSAMVVGFHCLALPIAACLAVVVRGARLGTGLAEDLLTVGVGGLLVGVGLVFVGDRALRRRTRSRHRPRFDLRGPYA
jgi:hypothetical protein